MIGVASIDPSRLVPRRLPATSNRGTSPDGSDASNRVPSPPPYTAPSLLDADLPPYTPIHRPNEVTIQNQPVDPHSVRSTPNSTLDYVYSTKNMTLSLGRRINGTDCPSYGRNGLITGSLTVHSFKHAKEVSISVGIV